MALILEKLFLDELDDLSVTNFTQGSVLFVGASAVAEDNSNLFWDDTTNRLGIRNADPRQVLSIGDNMGMPQGTIVTIGKSNGLSGLLFGEDSDNFVELFWNNAVDTFNIGVEVASIFKTVMTFDTDNVGINTATFGTSAEGVLAIANGTQGAAAADMVQLVAKDWNGAGTSALHIMSEENVEYIFGSVFTRSGGLNAKTTRTTTTVTLDATNYDVPCDTDGGAFTVTLEAGVAGTEHRISNTGTSANNLTIAPNGAELLLGVNSNFTLFDGESLTIIYEGTEGWN